MLRRSFFVIALAALVVGVGAPSVSAAPGDLDPAFGDGGTVVLPDPQIGGPQELVAQAGRLRTVHVAGNRLIRLRGDGSLDPSFGSAGIVEFDPAEGKVADVSPDRHGRLLVVRWLPAQPDAPYTIVRLLANGAPDGTFGSGGTALVDRDDCYIPVDVVERSDEHIVVVETVQPVEPCDVATQGDVSVVALTPTGDIDMTVGIDGRQQIDLGANEVVHTATVQPDGRLLLAASRFETEPQPQGSHIVVRLDKSLQLDVGFGGSGGWTMVMSGIDGPFVGRVVWSRGTIVVGGGAVFVGTGQPHAYLAALDDNGQPRPGFGDNGVVPLPLDADPSSNDGVGITGLAVRDGRVVATWAQFFVPTESFVARLDLETGAFDPTFGNNGIVGPHVDYGYQGVAVARTGQITVGGWSNAPEGPTAIARRFLGV